MFGVCEIDPFRDRFLLSANELQGLMFAVVLGIPLSRAVLEGIVDRPTLLYKWHYRQANNQLDRIAFLLTQTIVEMGYRALPIPASQIIDWEKQRAHVSHRMLAEAAGLGWRGRNNLLVTRHYGAQVRLVTVLTDLPLEPDESIENGCDKCHRCVSVCPADALGEDASEYDLDRCYKKLTEFSMIRGIGQHICGVCVKACFGRH